MLLALYTIFTVTFVLLGIVFSIGKGASLIAGYNTASAAEQEEYDEIKLCKFMGKFMFALAGCWLVITSSEIFKEISLMYLGLCLFFAALVIGVIYANTDNRFKK